MRVARFFVTNNLLRELLHLPVNTVIEHAYDSREGWMMTEIVITHPDLPDVTIAEGAAAPLINPVFEKREPVVLIDWGVGGSKSLETGGL